MYFPDFPFRGSVGGRRVRNPNVWDIYSQRYWEKRDIRMSWSPPPAKTFRWPSPRTFLLRKVLSGMHWTGFPNKSSDQIGKRCPKRCKSTGPENAKAEAKRGGQNLTRRPISLIKSLRNSLGISPSWSPQKHRPTGFIVTSLTGMLETLSRTSLWKAPPGFRILGVATCPTLRWEICKATSRRFL